MGRKRKTPEEMILESWEGSRNGTEFFSSISDDAYLGYITAMTMAQYPQIGLSAREIYDLADRLILRKEV